MIRDFGITWAHRDQIVSGLASDGPRGIHRRQVPRQHLQSGRGCGTRCRAGLDIDCPDAYEQRYPYRPAVLQRATGLAIYSIGDGVSQTIVRTVNAAPGWTSIVPFDLNGDGLTDLLSYNTATGQAFFSIATGVGEQQVVGPPVQGAAGWTSIVPIKVTLVAFSERRGEWSI